MKYVLLFTLIYQQSPDTPTVSKLQAASSLSAEFDTEAACNDAAKQYASFLLPAVGHWGCFPKSK
jgi:hypothetical protein